MAEASTDVSVRHVHLILAKMYRIRLQAEERELPRVEPLIHGRGLEVGGPALSRAEPPRQPSVGSGSG